MGTFGHRPWNPISLQIKFRVIIYQHNADFRVDYSSLRMNDFKAKLTVIFDGWLIEKNTEWIFSMEIMLIEPFRNWFKWAENWQNDFVRKIFSYQKRNYMFRDWTTLKFQSPNWQVYRKVGLFWAYTHFERFDIRGSICVVYSYLLDSFLPKMELNRENFLGLTQQEFIYESNSIFSCEALSRTSSHRWYSEFNRDDSSFQDEFRVVPKMML